MRDKLREEPTEWLDPEDAKLYQEGLEQAMSGKEKDTDQAEPSVEMPPTPPSPPRRVQPRPSSAPEVPLRDPPTLFSTAPSLKRSLRLDTRNASFLLCPLHHLLAENLPF